jgi:hypothetical protein
MAMTARVARVKTVIVLSARVPSVRKVVIAAFRAVNAVKGMRLADLIATTHRKGDLTAVRLSGSQPGVPPPVMSRAALKESQKKVSASHA